MKCLKNELQEKGAATIELPHFTLHTSTSRPREILKPYGVLLIGFSCNY